MKEIVRFAFTKKIALILAPILAIIGFFFSHLFGENTQMLMVLFIAIWMLIWWISEAVPLPVTALLPLILLPITGISELKEAAPPYASPIVFLFMGGFMIALALEKWKLHLRIALNIIRLTGTNANGIILGFLLATALLSMWISNTATTVMMLPIAASVIGLLTQNISKSQEKGIANFALCLMLGIAASANVGGVATIIGTPPNSVMAGFFAQKYNYDIDFASWFLIGFPFTLLMLCFIYWILVKVIYPNHLGNFEGSQELIQAELQKLGKLSKGEKATLIVFVSTAFLWITRSYWNSLFPFLKLSDAGIALIATVILFIFPISWKKGVFILKWEDTSQLAWGILLLFGGGLSLAGAFSKVGIIDNIGTWVQGLDIYGVLMINLALIVIVLLMTEVMSNVALIAVFIPMITGIAIGLEENPLWLAIPATMASSCAFMFPMATPPNAIVFASGHIKVSQMVKAGIWMNLFAVLLLFLLGNTIIPWILEVEVGQLPDWMK